jgi:hypothetical protein
MKKYKSAYLKEENMLTLLSQNNFIIPEIQREYVWGNNKLVITKFLQELKKKVGVICGTCQQPHSNQKINIGFLYSYKPDYVKVQQERLLDVNIIDGQQRFTTLFLLLFFCALKENRKRDFLALIRFEENLSMSFDFKVRDLTRRFLLEFINKTDSIEQIKSIEMQTWFLTDYKNDVSINAMINSLAFIIENFSENTFYYNQFLNNIVFWHFKTEATSQGEELYITMNARGEDLAKNEITKAALMLSGKQLFQSGQKWEEWQQYFWKHRDKGKEHQSADFGFNGFLYCIGGLEYFINKMENNPVEKDIRELLDISKIELYIESLMYIEKNKNIFTLNYNYSEWIVDAMSQIWGFWNDNNVDWFADFSNENKGVERNKMVFVWSILHYISKKLKENTIDVSDVFRFIRHCFMKYNNYDRSVISIIGDVKNAYEKGVWLSGTTIEEIKKYDYLKSITDNLLNVEELIWQIEDHVLNQNGRDLSAINISHIVGFDKNPTLEQLIIIRDAFNSLFPNNTKKGSSLLKSTLLFKGQFWKDTNTGYYERYDFSDWKRHIRKPEFSLFFREFIFLNMNLNLIREDGIKSFLNEKSEEIINAVEFLPEPSLMDRFKYYSIIIDSETLWKNGEHIAIYHNVKEGEIRLFENENKIIYNFKGYFRGYSGYDDLWTIANESNRNPLHYLKELVTSKS